MALNFRPQKAPARSRRPGGFCQHSALKDSFGAVAASEASTSSASKDPLKYDLTVYAAMRKARAEAAMRASEERRAPQNRVHQKTLMFLRLKSVFFFGQFGFQGPREPDKSSAGSQNLRSCREALDERGCRDLCRPIHRWWGKPRLTKLNITILLLFDPSRMCRTSRSRFKMLKKPNGIGCKPAQKCGRSAGEQQG